MNTPPATLSVHLAVWHQVLGGWLSWPEHRIDLFVDRWRKFFDPPTHADPEVAASFIHAFYHRWPAQRVVPLLISPSLRRRCTNDELFTIKREIESAIYLRDWYAHCLPSYDWAAAKKRVEAVLERHGAVLPKPDDLTWYEEEEQLEQGA